MAEVFIMNIKYKYVRVTQQQFVLYVVDTLLTLLPDLLFVEQKTGEQHGHKLHFLKSSLRTAVLVR